MPVFTVTTTARATITEHWRVEAETEAQARDYHEWPNRRVYLARDLIEGDEEEREVTFCVADDGKGAAEQDAIRRAENAAPAMLAALQEAERFVSGFEGDELQEGIDDLLQAMRAAIADATSIEVAPSTASASDEPEPLYRIDYKCPDCGHEWQEEWSCACDSECPNCGARDIQASDYEEIKAPEDEEEDAE